jgi:ribosomal protein S18 acetylase RimI-like enzyme
LTIRHLEATDYLRVTAVVDDWWGGRPMRALLPRLFFEHFRATSFVIEADGELRAFLIGFRSQTDASVAYIHFVGVHPQHRAAGIGRRLYLHFFNVVQASGCNEVHCITSPANKGSIAYHQRLGFELQPGDGVVGGVPVTLHHGGEDQHRVLFRKLLR